jgi:hypothetical protein
MNNKRTLENVKKFTTAKFLDLQFSIFILDTIFSAIGSLISFVVMASWIIVFQTNRIIWGKFADDISFIIPLGSP